MNVATSFLNSKGRRIYQGAKGGYFAKKADGTRVYGIKAAKRVAVGSNSAPRKIVNSVRNEVPSAIRPAVRKTRTNKGVARGPQVGVVQRRMDAEARRLAARRAAGRKTRSNKGVARGPRKAPVPKKEVAARVSAINELINAIKTANKMLNSAPKPRRSARLATMAATTNSKVRVSPKMKQMVRRRASAKK